MELSLIDRCFMNGLALAKRLGALLPLMSPVGFASSSSFTSLQQYPKSLGDWSFAANWGQIPTRSSKVFQGAAHV